MLRIQRQCKGSLPKSWQNDTCWAVHSAAQHIKGYLLYPVRLESSLKGKPLDVERM